MLESDSVRHYSAECFQDQVEPFVYDSLKTVLEGEYLTEFFEGVKKWGQNNCLNPGSSGPTGYGGFGFTTRALRDV